MARDVTEMRDGLSQVFVRIALPVMLALFVTWSVLHTGLPVLRHDWRVPLPRDEEAPWLGTFFNGWLPSGIGEAQPYPTFYLLGFALWPLRMALDSVGIMALLIFASIYIAVGSAAQILRTEAKPVSMQVAVSLFAALNPWVYSKYVAGHMIQVFAYAALLALVAEITRDRPRRTMLLLLSAFSITQIEFFAVACVPLIVWAWLRREKAVASILLLAAAPIVLGISASFGQIRGTPLNLVWQQSQSLQPASALALSGYFPDYARGFQPFAFIAYAFGLWACAALPFALRRAAGRLALFFAVALLLLTMGTKGFTAPVYDWFVLNVPAIGLFRELYDLIALVVIAYVVLISYGCARVRFPGIILTAGAACWLVPWVSGPPARYFVAAQQIPHAANLASVSSRVAYLPAFQPFSFEGRGSGVDPDAYVQEERGTPLNEFFPTFPVDAALAQLQRGHTSEAQALGVSQIVVRPYLHSNIDSLRYQFVGIKAGAFSPKLRSSARLVALPLLGILAHPAREATLADRADENAVFFGDRAPSSVARFLPSRETNNPARAWVDARLAVPLRPELSSAFGGAITTSKIPIRIPLEKSWNGVLVAANGTLIDDGDRVIAKDISQLAWRPLSPGTKTLTCYGTCAAILAGVVPRGLPDHVALGSLHGLSVHFSFPWFATAFVPAGMSGTLRFAVRYDRGWIAILGARLLPHERLATALNAWKLPKAKTKARAIYLIEIVAAIQFLLELLAAGTLIVLIAREALRLYVNHRNGTATSVTSIVPAKNRASPGRT